MDDFRLEPAHDLGLPLAERAKSLRRESGLPEFVAHRVWWAGVRLYLRTYHRLRIEGRENIPLRPPFVLAANHASHLDALVLASAVSWRWRDRIVPIAAGDTFFSTNMTAFFAAAVMNALPMWRRGVGRHALAEMRERLARDECVYILFPEGTRTRSGAMASFRSGIGMMVAQTSVPVVPCRVEGTFEAFGPNARWPRWKKLRLRIGPAMTFETISGYRRGWDEIARRVETAIRELG